MNSRQVIDQHHSLSNMCRPFSGLRDADGRRRESFPRAQMGPTAVILSVRNGPLIRLSELRSSAGVTAHVVVASGIVVVTVAGEAPTTLAPRDAIIFPADAVHGFHNVGEREAVLYVTLSSTSVHD